VQNAKRLNSICKLCAKNGVAVPSNMTIDTNIVIAYLAGEQSVTETIISWRMPRKMPILKHF